jgi:formylglycine-generating enzyme required for sulfatase activity
MALLPGGVVMRRVAIACALWAVALGAACNSLLGNSEHTVAGDASSDASGSETSPGPDSGKDHMVQDGGSDTSTGGTDSGIHPEQSCKAVGPGRTNCGASSGGGADGGDGGDGGFAGESCCTSLPVTGGKYDRSYDDVTFTDPGHPATVSPFNLDKYEITVGRFRKFVTAVVGGWLPLQGSGKHTHLNGGAGLRSTTGGSEGGWDATDWNVNLSTSLMDWTNNLTCNGNYWTWTMTPGTNENNPINCETWYEAYAFCIWDGGFLPSEAEWNYAAAGGGGASGQRVYPWSVPSTDPTIDCAHTNYISAEGGICVSTGTNSVGSESPAGDGFFHQVDMAGNVWEWNLDASNVKSPVTSYVNPCIDCAFTSGPLRVFRGGSFVDDAPSLLTSLRRSDAPDLRANFVGARCARAP